jgi:translocation and assembly module TamB
LRFFSKRAVLTVAAIFIVLVLAIVSAVLYFVNSPGFEERAREYIVREIEMRTGGHATLDHFRWSLRQQRFVLEGLTFRGLESASDPPLARVESITVGIRLRTLLQRRVDLFELTITRPDIHLLVDANGRTNLPNPPPQGNEKLNVDFSIGKFSIADGMAFLNERKVPLDLALANLASTLSYAPAAQILSAQVSYDGQLQLEDKPAIPYTFAGNLDYTRGTIVAQHIDVKSGKSALALQGRINDVLSKNIAGRLEYTGPAAVPFLNYFFPKESFAGSSKVAGFFEFSDGYFFTRGNAVSDSITFDGWNVQQFRGEYSYKYPDRRLALHHMTTRALGGTATGDITVGPLPGEPRVELDLKYADVDAAQLVRLYPWDPMYRIYSRLTGGMHGWFEGKFDRFELAGGVDLKSYTPEPAAGIVALPLDGSTEYDGEPNRVRVTQASGRLFSTDIQADGLIERDAFNLKANLKSPNLADLSFIYSNANGRGAFDGTLTGPLKTPLFEGTFDLEGHKHGEFTIQHATGGIRLDTLSQVANLRNVDVTQGQSTVRLNGSTTLDGAKVDLQARATGVRAEDIAPFAARVTDRKFTGVFSGAIHITSLDPIRFDDDLRADDLVVEGQRVGNVTARVRYQDPEIELQKLTVSDNGAALTGNVSYNRMTEALNFNVAIANSLNMQRLRSLGVLPKDLEVEGVIRTAEFTGSGTLSQPRIRGKADLRDIVFHGETFPQADVNVDTSGSQVNVTFVERAHNLKLTAAIDTSKKGYPFDADVSFDRYSIEKLVGFNQGTVTVSGDVVLKNGLLNDTSRLTGAGSVREVHIAVDGRSFQNTTPFKFEFNPTQLTLSDVSLTGPEGTRATVSGTIALTKEAKLNLQVKDAAVDLALVPTLLRYEDPSLKLAGAVRLSGTIGGTPDKPELGGIAQLTNASISKTGFSVNVTNLNGSVGFGGERITLNDLEGRVGPGTIGIRGFATLKGWQLDAMSIPITARDIRIRYPEGLRSIVGGELMVRGTRAAPVLDGRLQIQTMAYRGAFENFIGLFQAANRIEPTGSDLGRLALSVHVEGSRDITIKNELADVQARVDLDIKGTVDRPALTGHVEASGGTLTFQNKRYEISRGNMDFVDPLRIEPVIDVQAETQIRNYRVILSVAGRGDHVVAHFRSDPPLPEAEIFSLITGGRTREELQAQTSNTGRIPTSEELFQSGAASIFSDLLKSRVVPSRFGLLGLERTRIDPALVGPENNPSARITVPLQVSKDLSITYSYDLTKNTEYIVQVEYFVSKNISILAIRDEYAEVGLDIRLRRRY